ncbi:UNVERIFIED_CONTAM: hypothetical protein Slati_1143700 [Sesamum latifolium]|uniref:Uncharacterized protein n=1 Tax=Sesamum latifolium TaxID=2727402 RepID=A0AAW2XD48_9LAMI
MFNKLIRDNTSRGGCAAGTPPPSRSSRGTPALSDYKEKHPATTTPGTSTKRAKVNSLGTPPTSSARLAATHPLLLPETRGAPLLSPFVPQPTAYTLANLSIRKERGNPPWLSSL